MKPLENQRFAVGRAGHDPATYGLKGRATKRVSPEDSRGGLALVKEHVPSVAQAQAAEIPFAPGDVVEITDGMSKGLRGTVLGPARSMYLGVADVALRMEFGREAWIRPDWLRRLG
jgi:transcription antitermination factor NusG